MSAFFFVTHGSRNQRSLEQLNRLVALAQTTFPDYLIGGGCLEGLPVSLADQLIQFSNSVVASEYDQIKVIPIFLLPGVHVRQDLPAQIKLAQESSDRFQFQLTDYLGNHPNIPETLAQKFLGLPNRILISHGSKLTGGNAQIEQLANQVQAVTAYWSIEPSLTSQIDNLLAQGLDQVSVMPYFLFPGGITEAIATQISGYKQVKLLETPFGPLEIAKMGLEMATTFALKP
jgi:sirohydrochlorin cobaltochelatase